MNFTSLCVIAELSILTVITIFWTKLTVGIAIELKYVFCINLLSKCTLHSLKLELSTEGSSISLIFVNLKDLLFWFSSYDSNINLHSTSSIYYFRSWFPKLPWNQKNLTFCRWNFLTEETGISESSKLYIFVSFTTTVMYAHWKMLLSVLPQWVELVEVIEYFRSDFSYLLTLTYFGTKLIFFSFYRESVKPEMLTCFPILKIFNRVCLLNWKVPWKCKALS